MDKDIIAAKVEDALRAALRGRASMPVDEAETVITAALRAFTGPPPRWNVETQVADDLTISVTVSESRGPSLN